MLFVITQQLQMKIIAKLSSVCALLLCPKLSSFSSLSEADLPIPDADNIESMVPFCYMKEPVFIPDIQKYRIHIFGEQVEIAPSESHVRTNNWDCAVTGEINQVAPVLCCLNEIFNTN